MFGVGEGLLGGTPARASTENSTGWQGKCPSPVLGINSEKIMYIGCGILTQILGRLI